MHVDEILGKVRFVVDPKTGKKSAVLIDYAIWEELLTLLEGAEDSTEVDRIAREGEEYEPREQAKAELSDDRRDDTWITDELNKVYSEVDSSLDPVIAAMQWASLRKVEW